jgi:hypothetical protein
MPGAQGDAVLEFRAGTPVHCGGASEASEEEEEEESLSWGKHALNEEDPERDRATQEEAFYHLLTFILQNNSN